MWLGPGDFDSYRVGGLFVFSVTWSQNKTNLGIARVQRIAFSTGPLGHSLAMAGLIIGYSCYTIRAA